MAPKKVWRLVLENTFSPNIVCSALLFGCLHEISDYELMPQESMVYTLL